MNVRKQALALGLAVGIGMAVSATAYADGQGGMGPGMMGPGMMGPGMMGPGMMGPGMMGSGMMGGGMGPGMMGGQYGTMPCLMMGSMYGMQPLLDEEQQGTLLKIRKELRAARYERMKAMMGLQDEMMAEMQKPAPDPEQVKTLHGQMAELQGEAMADRIRMHNKMRNLLTDKQNPENKAQ